MTSLTQGNPLPNITTTKSTTTSGPDWYNTLLQDAAKAGTDLMGKSGEELIAPMSDLQKGALQSATGDLSHYKDLMGKAGVTAEEAAKGITPEMIQMYLNPYTQNVVNEMGRLSTSNLQRNLLPALTSAFVGSGGYNSQRMGGALGQMGADVASNLAGLQGKELEAGYNKALDTALAQAGLKRSAAATESDIASADLSNATKALEEQYGLGEKQQKFEQSKILAPTAAAKSALDVYANVKVPSTVSETANAPIPGAYSTSPLSQIAGIASLFASASGGDSAARGALRAIFGDAAVNNPGGFLGWLKSQGFVDGGTDTSSDTGGTDTSSGTGGTDTTTSTDTSNTTTNTDTSNTGTNTDTSGTYDYTGGITER